MTVARAGSSAMLGWVSRNKVVVAVSSTVGFGWTVLLFYGFDRWWPADCTNFNTHLQRSLTVQRAQDAVDSCPSVTAGDVQEALVVDTIFPVAYATFLAGTLLLLALLPFASPWVSRSAVWLARAAIVGGVLDLTLENGSLVLVTLEGWPPSATGSTEALLLVAGLAAWVKYGLLVLAVLGLMVLLVAAAALGVRNWMRRHR